MEFSDEAVKFAGPVPPTSPDGRYVAVAVEYRLIVRDWQTLRVVQMYSCLDRIQHVEWSSDSSYILCGLYDRSIVQVWSILEPEWTCKIDEGLAGITSARWCPDGRSILVTAEFQIKATVWSLVDKACVQLAGPKFADAGLAFNPDGTQLAVAERNNCKDFLTILACSDWKTQVHFQLPTQDLADLCWSPSGDCLAVWDSLLTYRLLVYSSYGDQLANYTPYADALGIKTVHWSPCGQFIAVGSYDEAARILSHVTWRPLLTCSHTASVSEPSNVVAYREVASRDDKDTDNSTSKYVVCELPVSIPSKTPPLDKPDPKLGVGVMAWSPTGKYLMTRNDNMPTTAWVWNVETMDLMAVLVHKNPVQGADWDLRSETLAICCGSTRLYLWSPSGASVVHIPLPALQASGIRWQKSGEGFILTDVDAFCIGYLTN